MADHNYQSFLQKKSYSPPTSGIDPGEISEVLYPFQRVIVEWAVRRGRSAIFADCGLGKTLMQLEWARHIGGPTLIVAPLGVTQQTILEAEKLGMRVEYVKEPTDDPVQITNYQRLSKFIGHPYRSLVLDESSILKSLDGKTRTMILREFTGIPFRLACTATPAPNDLTELGNHAEFLGIMSNREMSATFFVKESNSMHWRLKGHASDRFFEWMVSWSLYLTNPGDIGFPDDRFDLPSLDIREMIIKTSFIQPGRLFPVLASGIQGRIDARRSTIDERVAAVADLCRAEPDKQWIVWCGLNSEGRILASTLGDDSVLVEGSMDEQEKLKRAQGWLAGDSRVLITKPSIYGFGMNFQNCSRMAFLGLGDSYEQYYQAIRRCWRYGQTDAVNVHVVTTEAEYEVVKNIRRKHDQAEKMSASMVEQVGDLEKAVVQSAEHQAENYEPDHEGDSAWDMYLGDSAEVLSEVEDDSVGLSVFSPPFVSLYTYSATARDLGNSKDEGVFFEHFGYINRELLRATMPGRNCCVHVAQVPAMLVRDGYIGLKDFRARTVKEFTEAGWIYHGEIVIDKDPQAQAIRTKAKGLLFATLKRDSAWLRPALADYILVFRKPGENPTPIVPDVTNEEWIQWARPIWYGIRETETLNYREARTEKDERHICPLQLGTIERCVRLWSNRGDLVCSPFAGIGSEGHVAIEHERRFVGVELKREYYELACKNLNHASKKNRLF